MTSLARMEGSTGCHKQEPPTTTFVKQQNIQSNMATKSKSATALFTALQNHNVSSLALPKMEKLVAIDSKMTPIDAANVLWANDILGAPVWDEETHKYCGIFDMRDFLSAVVAASVRPTKDTDEYNTAMVHEMEDMKHDNKAVQVTSTLTYLASRNPVLTCEPDTCLAEICKLLSAPACRRVLVCTSKGARSTNMVSRTAMLKFLSEHVSRHDLKETLDQAGLEFRKQVVQVEDSVPARKAFELIDSKGIYGLAVVDEEGTLLANTSASDIKLAAMDKGKASMDLDILSYLAAVRQDAPPQGGNERYPASHVHEDSTVGHVLNLLVKTGYHRVFVVNQYVQPIGVISQQDILRFIVGKE